MATTPLFTFQDVVEHLWDIFNPASKPPTGRELRMAKRAVLAAYREATTVHNWNYYKREAILRVDGQYNTGTVAYDHTGGTYERELTLSGGTWPANAKFGYVELSGVRYPIEDRKSSTVVTLLADANPGADVAAGASYAWRRDTYPLPVNFLRMLSVMSASGDLELCPASSKSQFVISIAGGSAASDSPSGYAIRGGSNYSGGLELVLSAAPVSSREYTLLYMAAPMPLVTYKYATGTASVLAGQVAVTGGGTAFTAAHEGAVIRFTTSTTVEPTDTPGNVDGTDNPYLAQRVVVSVANGTSLTIDAPVSALTNLSGVKYTISDMVDVEPITMRSYVEALASYHYARLTKRDEADDMFTEARRCMLEAMAQDARHAEIQHAVLDTGAWGSAWGDVETRPDLG